MKRPCFPSKWLSKLELERRALLIQLGGYENKGELIFYSESGKLHLAAVTARKERIAKMAALSATATTH
ncbi:hypothetical protein QRD43_21155 [Pelomonas sp. APW6]|uniref:Uncharacterized protein n=1 Tax=Roseateles subflavus TaxID=3053353 RepID=A0ABT7LRT1_9BURK|nr:hypothetical protein [Pelomonas sp. APW6]MDL5034425.1 hypothetical protein [Pelomonas sp. APW6]